MPHATPDTGPGNSEPIDPATVKVFLENQGAFKGFLRKQLSSETAVEDLLQQSLLKAIRSNQAMAEKENPKAWFYRILRNSLTDYYRSRAAEGRRLEGFLNDSVTSGQDSQAAPDEALMGEVCACLNRLLPTLKPEYADLIRRIDLGEEEPGAVAEAQGITYNNLMVRLHRARQSLRKNLEHSCGACTKHGCLDCTCGQGSGHKGH